MQCSQVVICTGTFLDAEIHIGDYPRMYSRFPYTYHTLSQV